MQIETLVLGMLESNCHIVTDDATGEIAVVDPGFPLKKLLTEIETRKDRVKLILLTHRHFDHILGAAAVQEITGAKIAIHALDAAGLESPEASLAGMSGGSLARRQVSRKPDILLSDNDVLTVGNLRFRTVHTPGHTAGSVCFVCEDVIFSGDTLFFESVGRTDFPTGNFEALKQSFRKLAALPGDYRVLPGHYEETSLEHERRHNPLARFLTD